MNTMVLSILRHTKVLALMNSSGSMDVPVLGERRALSRTGPHEQMCFYGSPGESPPGVKARTSAFLQGTLFRSRGHQCGMLIDVCCGYQAIIKIYNNPWNVSKNLHHWFLKKFWGTTQPKRNSIPFKSLKLSFECNKIRTLLIKFQMPKTRL